MKKKLIRLLPTLIGKYINFLAIRDKKLAAKMAFNVFAKVRKGKVRPSQKPFLDAAKLEVAKINGLDIQAYRWEGEKGPVLLLHGWESNTYRWKSLITELTKNDFEVIAFDAPAHGYSSGHQMYVPLYSECLQYFMEKYSPKAVVAHSIGGMTILYNQFVALDHQLEKIVALGAPAEFVILAKDYQRVLGLSKKTYDALNDYVKQRFGFHINEFSTTNFVQNNPQKGLLIHDEEDKTIPISQSILTHNHWKNSELVTTKGLGHSLNSEKVNDKIISFLKS